MVTGINATLPSTTTYHQPSGAGPSAAPSNPSVRLAGRVVQVEAYTVGCRLDDAAGEHWVQLPPAIFPRAPWPDDRIELEIVRGPDGFVGLPRVHLFRDAG